MVIYRLSCFLIFQIVEIPIAIPKRGFNPSSLLETRILSEKHGQHELVDLQKPGKTWGSLLKAWGLGSLFSVSKKGMVAIAGPYRASAGKFSTKRTLDALPSGSPLAASPIIVMLDQVTKTGGGGGWKHCLRGILLFLRHWWWHDLHLRFSKKTCWKTHAPRSESKPLILGMVIPPLTGNPYNGYINTYCKVDDHPTNDKTCLDLKKVDEEAVNYRLWHPPGCAAAFGLKGRDAEHSNVFPATWVFIRQKSIQWFFCGGLICPFLISFNQSERRLFVRWRQHINGIFGSLISPKLQARHSISVAQELV